MPVKNNIGGGVNTLKDTATEMDVRSEKTFHAGKGTKPKSGNIPDLEITDITPGSENIIIPRHKYINNPLTIHGDDSLVSENIKAGVSIFGVFGKASVVDTETDVLDSGKMAKGQKGHKNGQLVEGTLEEITPKDVSLDPGGSHVIEHGIHSGSAVVKAKPLKEVTGDTTLSSAGQLLSGITAISKGVKYTGDMPDNGNFGDVLLGAGESKVVPYGFTKGGKVSVKTLAAMTAGATAVDNRVVSGYTYWKNGILRTGNLTVNSVVSFSVAVTSSDSVTATWKNPAKGPYSGVIIRYKTGSYPTSPSDGIQAYKGFGNNAALNAYSSAVISGLYPSTTYYFRIWMYCNTSIGELTSGYMQSVATTLKAQGTRVITVSGQFIVPAGVTSVDVCLVSGGNGGSSAWFFDDDPEGGDGGGGAGRGVHTFRGIAVTPGQVINVTIGAGGYAGGDSRGGFGVGSTFGVYTNAKAAVGKTEYGPIAGASSAGRGGKIGYQNNGGDGNSDGNGPYGWGPNGSKQGGTTRAFGEPSGTLYGGAGGGGKGTNSRGRHGYGGAGGGGDGSGYGQPGTPNTGGGAGGATSLSSSHTTQCGAAGGSGVVIVRWGY